MSDEHEQTDFHEVDAATGKSAYRTALESLHLTEQELLLGKVDENGDILWSGSPRWLFKHPGTWPTVDGVVDDIFGADGPPADAGECDR